MEGEPTGGLGSGRWSRWHRITTIEECRWLDVLYLHRNNILYSGCSCTLSWKRNGRPWGEIRIEVEATSLVLIYHYAGYGEECDVEELISLDWTRCFYGGTRPRFRCPSCGRRVGVLFLGGSNFLCRHCYHLSYSSQNEDETSRMNRKANKLRQRLGEERWQKPKGMHTKTYDRLRRRLSRADMLADILIDREVGKLRAMGLW
jgi:hypothetical protein